MSDLKSKFQIILDRLKSEGKVQEFSESESNVIVEKVQKELKDYRFSNQKRIRESQEDISTVILTA